MAGGYWKRRAAGGRPAASRGQDQHQATRRRPSAWLQRTRMERTAHTASSPPSGTSSTTFTNEHKKKDLHTHERARACAPRRVVAPDVPHLCGHVHCRAQRQVRAATHTCATEDNGRNRGLTVDMSVRRVGMTLPSTEYKENVHLREVFDDVENSDRPLFSQSLGSRNFASTRALKVRNSATFHLSVAGFSRSANFEGSGTILRIGSAPRT